MFRLRVFLRKISATAVTVTVVLAVAAVLILSTVVDNAWLKERRFLARFDCETLPEEEHLFEESHTFIAANPAYLGARITDIEELHYDRNGGADQVILCRGILRPADAPPVPVEFWGFTYPPARDRMAEWKVLQN